MAWRPLRGPGARAVRLTGLVLVIGIFTVVAGALLLPAALRAFVRGMELGLGGAVWVAATLDSGAGSWTIVATIGRAAARALLTPRALATIVALILLGAVALYGLQRLLGLEEE